MKSVERVNDLDAIETRAFFVADRHRNYFLPQSETWKLAAEDASSLIIELREARARIDRLTAADPTPAYFDERCLAHTDPLQCLLEGGHDGPHRFSQIE